MATFLDQGVDVAGERRIVAQAQSKDFGVGVANEENSVERNASFGCNQSGKEMEVGNRGNAGVGETFASTDVKIGQIDEMRGN